MKKIFHAIVILTVLSAIGVIWFQISWLNNLIKLQEQKFFSDITKTLYSVSAELTKQYSGVATRIRPGNLLSNSNDGLSLRHARPLAISQRYTDSEVYDILRKSFDSFNLRELQFEFAITSEVDDGALELQSKDFDTEFNDTINNKNQHWALIYQNDPTMGQGTLYGELIIVIPDYKKQIWGMLTGAIIAAFVFISILIAAFVLTLRTVFVQKKLSEIKSDFINNMTHEFKTPLATISLAVDAIRNRKVQNDPEKMHYFSSIIKEENVRMNKHVETILQAASMEKQELRLDLEKVYAHEIIHGVIDNFVLVLEQKNVQTELQFNATNDCIEVDEIHFSNLISNLIDNAIKYSKDNLLIRIITHTAKKHLVIRVEDNGVGMSKETIKRIFEKFYRAHTGNLHDVKGFGLGMSYVKSVIDAHKGNIKVESILGKGSAFIVEIPLGK